MSEQNRGRSSEWDIEVGSDLSRASTADRPMSRAQSRVIDGQDVNRMQTLSRSNTIRMTTDAFEKLYLSPQNRIKGDLRSMLAVPTPIAIVGLIVAAGPLGCSLMEWRGAAGLGAATLSASYFFGGMLQLVGGVMEWLVGNTFPFVVFTTFGSFFLAYGMNQDPRYNVKANFVAAGTTAEQKAELAAEYEGALGFFYLFCMLVTLILLICSLRTNVVFFLNLFCVQVSITLLTSAAWVVEENRLDVAVKIGKAAGAFVFVTCLLLLYLLAAIMLEAVAFPISLPVGDLSTRFGRRRQSPPVHPLGKGLS